MKPIVKKTYLEVISTTRVRPKVVMYFALHDKPVRVSQLARAINEDTGPISALLREFTNKGFLEWTGKGYILKRTDLKEELISISTKTFLGERTTRKPRSR